MLEEYQVEELMTYADHVSMPNPKFVYEALMTQRLGIGKRYVNTREIKAFLGEVALEAKKSEEKFREFLEAMVFETNSEIEFAAVEVEMLRYERKLQEAHLQLKEHLLAKAEEKLEVMREEDDLNAQQEEYSLN